MDYDEDHRDYRTMLWYNGLCICDECDAIVHESYIEDNICDDCRYKNEEL